MEWERPVSSVKHATDEGSTSKVSLVSLDVRIILIEEVFIRNLNRSYKCVTNAQKDFGKSTLQPRLRGDNVLPNHMSNYISGLNITYTDNVSILNKNWFW